MVVRAPGDTPFPPDVSGAAPFQDDVELPWWQGGGKGFGPGGFFGSPKITPNASGPAQGLSLGGSAHVDPTTGKPEMLTGPGGLVEKTRGSINPFGFIGGGNPYWRGAIAAGGVLTPSPAETGEFNPAMVAGRPEAPMGGVHGVPAAAAPSQPPARPYTPTPATAYPAAPMPARPVTPTPRAAAPRAAASPPSAFTLVDRPNADVAGGARGRQSVPRISALDLSKLFARQS